MSFAPSRWVAAAAWMSMIAGCTLAPVNVDTRTHVLTLVPGEVKVEPTGDVDLVVMRPEAPALYDTVRMAYSIRPYEIAYYRDNEWGDTPAAMIQPLIVRTLEATRAFNAVVSAPAPRSGGNTYVLKSQLLELEQDFTAAPARLRLSMRFDLSRYGPERIVATRDISVQEDMAQRSPEAGVAAANEATARLLRELAAFVVEKTRD